VLCCCKARVPQQRSGEGVKHPVTPMALLALLLAGEPRGLFAACVAILSLPTTGCVRGCTGRRGWCLNFAVETQTPMHSLT